MNAVLLYYAGLRIRGTGSRSSIFKKFGFWSGFRGLECSIPVEKCNVVFDYHWVYNHVKLLFLSVFFLQGKYKIKEKQFWNKFLQNLEGNFFTYGRYNYSIKFLGILFPADPDPDPDPQPSIITSIDKKLTSENTIPNKI